jgi:hypothetical protein
MTNESDRFAHEDTANDRWIGALIEVQLRDTPERVDALVDRAMVRVRTGSATETVRTAGSIGISSTSAAPRVRRWDWRTPVAAAASIAIIVGSALLFSPQPASANSILRAAQVAESGSGDRRYALELIFPARAGESEAQAPRATGTLDIRDAEHVRLDIRFQDGRAMTRGTDGATGWTVDQRGEVLSMPTDARWPRFIETPEGDLLADRLDVLLADVGAHYQIVRCDKGGAMQICATRDDSGFRGPETIELTIDPDTKLVTRAALSFGGPAEGSAPANRASETMASTGSGRPDATTARPARDDRPGAGPGGPEGGRGPKDGRGPEGGRGPGRRAEPRMVIIERSAVPGGAFDAAWFSPPSVPVRQAPPPEPGPRGGPGGKGPNGPGGGVGGPGGPGGPGGGPPPRGDR